MGKITKLPSGTYRTLVFLGTDANGKKIVKSITDTDKKRLAIRASELASQGAKNKSGITLGSCIDAYIEKKTPVLAPSTISGYHTIRRQLNSYRITDMKVDRITNDEYQGTVNKMMDSLSGKSIRNIFSLISKSLKDKNMDPPRVTLPAKVRPELHIPDTDHVKQILQLAKGTELEIPILLAATVPMRRGEICAAKWPEDFSGEDQTILHIHRSLSIGEDNQYHEKSPKTYDSDRYVELSPDIVQLIRAKGYITKYAPHQISNQFRRLQEQNNIHPKCRFHDLRHYAASIMLYWGFSFKAVGKRGGWKNYSTIERTYDHVMSEEQRKADQIANDRFKDMLM